MKLKPQYIASTEGGKFRIVGMTGKDWSEELLRMFPDMRLTITVEKKQKTRSNDQNEYYWGVVIPLVIDGFKGIGEYVDKDIAHDFLKRKFTLGREIISPHTGEVEKMDFTTTTLSTKEMMDYFEKIQQWAATFLNTYIPDPNEQTIMTFE